MTDEVTLQIRAAAEELFDRWFETLWRDRRAEIEVWPGRRIDRQRKVVTEGIELIGHWTGDKAEWPGYFEPVRERRWFSREWSFVQSVDDAAENIATRIERWANRDDA